MSEVNYKDTVKINHPEIEGTGIITRFLNDKLDGVEVKIIEAHRKSDGKEVKPGKKFYCVQQYLTTIEKYEFKNTCIITDDKLMIELFASEDAREEALGVVTPEFVGQWSLAK